MLRLIRTHLGLDVAFVSRLANGRRTFRYVDAVDGSAIEPGDSDPAADSYCAYVIDGTLPKFLHDPAQHPVSAGLRATYDVPVGTHLSVPIWLSDGDAYGTLCSFSYQVHDHLEKRDLRLLDDLAEIISSHVEAAESRRRVQNERAMRLSTLKADHDLVMRFQPVVEISTGHVVGVEALARFPNLGTGPAELFQEAWRLGVGLELELRAARAALHHIDELPDGLYLAVNLAPGTLASKQCLDLLADSDPERLVVEITEHAAVEDYEQLESASRHLRRLGVRLAIDDVGTGYSGLDHMLRVEPDILKLDGALVSGIDRSSGKQAMTTALQTYAARIHADIIAERIETAAEHNALGILGIAYGQGYHYARPAPMNELFAPSPELAHAV